jgi:antitoxin ParD1/3/4
MPSSYVVGEHFEAFIKNQIQQGRYASASEVIRDGLRSLEDREKFRAMKLETLRAEIQKGADSGAGVSSKAAFAEVRTRIAKVAAGQSGKS